MTKLTSRRWAIIFFISLALNLFLGGLIVADKYFKDSRSKSFRSMMYSVPWARRVIGDEVRPMAREIFRAHRESFIGNRKVRAELYQKVSAVLATEPFDKSEFKKALGALQQNLQLGQTTMHSMMADFAAKELVGLNADFEQQNLRLSNARRWSKKENVFRKSANNAVNGGVKSVSSARRKTQRPISRYKGAKDYAQNFASFYRCSCRAAGGGRVSLAG